MPTIQDDDPSRANAHVDLDIDDDDSGMLPGTLSEIFPGRMPPEMLPGVSVMPAVQMRAAVQVTPAIRAMHAMHAMRSIGEDPPHAFEVPMDMYAAAPYAAPTRRSQVRMDVVPRAQSKDLMVPPQSLPTAAAAGPNQSIVEWIGNNVLSLMGGGGDNDMLSESASAADCAIMATLAVVVLAMCMFMQCTQQTILIRDLMRRL